MTAIDKVKASKAKCKRHRDNWRAKAIKAERELETYKSWALRIDKWHTELCETLGIKPVHPCGIRMINKLEGK